VDKEQTFKFGGDGGPKKANFAVIFPVTIGDTPTWIEAFVIEGNTPHLVSRRWLSKHKCLMCFDPENLCLESPEFGRVPLILHSSGHLLLSLIGKSKGSAAVHFVLPGVDGHLRGMGGVQVCDHHERQDEDRDGDDGRGPVCSYCLSDNDAESDDLDTDRGWYLGSEPDSQGQGQSQGREQGCEQGREQGGGEGTAQEPDASRNRDPDRGLAGGHVAVGSRPGRICRGPDRGRCRWWAYVCSFFVCGNPEADGQETSNPEDASDDFGGVQPPAAHLEGRTKQ
jgi:hypothetical protein